ncbi:CheR family methyltransferase [Sulfurospirillum sp. 1612]|uniref:CheR family methyltransferase n=1 Tax=Sulfurospirillum sp. 1612 TaxID=3094835 RepID=UPI002F95F737
MFGFWKKKKKLPPKEALPPIENFTNIDPFITYFKEETGIDFLNKKDIVTNKLMIFCRNHEIYTFDDCIQKIRGNYELKQKLIDTFAVNETYFFREIRQIKAMVSKAIQRQEKIQILCAPCSSGEEPYSIAILLLEAGIDAERFHITGVDISNKAILKAKQALYNKRSLHRVEDTLINKYFTQKNESYELKAFVKQNVSFERMNIFDPHFMNLPKFDYIFSRNMMIYFDDATKQKAKNILLKHLKDPKEPILFGHADMVG